MARSTSTKQVLGSCSLWGDGGSAEAVTGSLADGQNLAAMAQDSPWQGGYCHINHF